MHRSLIHYLVLPWLVVFIVFVSLISVYGDPAVATFIKVERKPTDSREEAELGAELISTANEIATQFELRSLEREKPHFEFTDHKAGENPGISLYFQTEDFPVEIRIDEHWIDLRTRKHLKLATTLLESLNARGFDATVTYHSPDYHTWCWVVSAALFAVAILLICNRKKSVLPDEVVA